MTFLVFWGKYIQTMKGRSGQAEEEQARAAQVARNWAGWSASSFCTDWGVSLAAFTSDYNTRKFSVVRTLKQVPCTKMR